MNWDDFWLVARTPSCWYGQQNPYSEAWDDLLNELLRDYPWTEIGRHTANLGPYKIWIANYPYSCMNPYESGPEVRPRRATIIRAHKSLIRQADWQHREAFEEMLV